MKNNSLSSMFDNVIANNARSASETKEVVGKAAARGMATTERCADEVKETTAKAIMRVLKSLFQHSSEVKENSAKIGKRIMDHSDENHAETRRVIREESDRNIRILSDNYTGGEYLIAFILGVLAGIGAWIAEKSVFYIPVAFDTAGNPIKYSTDLTMAFIFSAAVGVTVFFIVLWLVHTIAKRFR